MAAGPEQARGNAQEREKMASDWLREKEGETDRERADFYSCAEVVFVMYPPCVWRCKPRRIGASFVLPGEFWVMCSPCACHLSVAIWIMGGDKKECRNGALKFRKRTKIFPVGSMELAYLRRGFDFHFRTFGISLFCAVLSHPPSSEGERGSPQLFGTFFPMATSTASQWNRHPWIFKAYPQEKIL